MLQKIVFSFLALGFLTNARATVSDTDFESCRDLQVQVEIAKERVSYAQNAWSNREVVCEADLNRPNCFEYLKNDLKTAKSEYQRAKHAYQASDCSQK